MPFFVGFDRFPDQSIEHVKIIDVAFEETGYGLFVPGLGCHGLNIGDLVPHVNEKFRRVHRAKNRCVVVQHLRAVRQPSPSNCILSTMSSLDEEMKMKKTIPEPFVSTPIRRTWRPTHVVSDVIDNLGSHERKIVEVETRRLASAVGDLGRSRLNIGKHLTRVQEILEPQRMFTRYLDSLNLNRSTAYNHINAYRKAQGLLPILVLNVASEKGINLLSTSPANPSSSGTSRT